MPVLTLALATCIGSAARLQMARWRLNNLLGQVEADPRLELLVIENGSDLLRDAVAAAAEKGLAARYRREPDPNYAAARNRAIELAAGGIIAVCDDDDLDYAVRPSSIIDSFAGRPEAAIYYSGYQICDAGFAVEETVQPDGSEPDFLPREQRIAHPTVAYRRDAVIGLGGYREDVFAIEDLDLLWRAKKAGLAWIPDPRVLVRYRKHQDQVTRAHEAQMRTAQRQYLKEEGFADY